MWKQNLPTAVFLCIALRRPSKRIVVCTWCLHNCLSGFEHRMVVPCMTSHPTTHATSSHSRTRGLMDVTKHCPSSFLCSSNWLGELRSSISTCISLYDETVDLRSRQGTLSSGHNLLWKTGVFYGTRFEAFRSILHCRYPNIQQFASFHAKLYFDHYFPAYNSNLPYILQVKPHLAIHATQNRQ